jgi:hypothetical protein
LSTSSSWSRFRPAFATGWLALALGASGGSGCERSSNRETHVDVPVTLAEIKKLAHAPDTVVSVQRQEATSGGGACGHSPVCVILIPILVFDALFPKKWDEASVIKNGEQNRR